MRWTVIAFTMHVLVLSSPVFSQMKENDALTDRQTEIRAGAFAETAPGERQMNVMRNVLSEDFLVNDDTSGGESQQLPAVAVNGKGDAIIAWADYRNGNYDIYMQRYDSVGHARGGNTRVNDDAGITDQNSPVIATDGGGNFVIAWEDQRNGNPDIYLQRYHSGGIAQGTNTKVNDDAGTRYQLSPSVAMDTGGHCTVAWQDLRSGNFDIYVQRSDSDGAAQGANTKVNDDPGNAIQFYPFAAMDGRGGPVIVWQDSRAGNYDIYLQRYDSSGIAQGANTKVNDDGGTAGQYIPSAARSGSGNFVVTWYDDRNGNYDIYVQTYDQEAVPVGVNRKVNDDAGTADQYHPSVAMDIWGNVVIAWQDYRDTTAAIFLQRYDTAGVARGANSKAGDGSATSGQYSPSVSIDPKGTFLVAWEDDRDGGPDIYSQRFDSGAVAQGINTKVNDDAGSVSQYSPSVAMNGEGTIVAAWQDNRVGNHDIYYQKYDSSGVARGINTRVNDDAGTGFQTLPSAAMDARGSVVIAWQDPRNGNADTYLQRYDSDGVALGANVRVNDDAGTASQYSPSVATDKNGNVVVVWYDYRNGNADIYLQRYDSGGVALGANVRVNDDAGTASQYSPSVAADARGNLIVAWYENRNGNYDIYLQKYDSTGVAQGANVKANDDAGRTHQYSPSVAADAHGNVVVAWYDNRNGNYDIYAQKYDSSGTAQGANFRANDDGGTAAQYFPAAATDEHGNVVIVWEDYRDGGGSPTIMGQRYHSNGSPWGTNYRVVSDVPYHGARLPDVAVSNRKIVFAWMDNRRSKGWDIYANVAGWDWDGVTSVLSEEDVPKEFGLMQNYPNPFNPGTRISFSVPAQRYVTLRVYDLLGREVATLVQEKKPQGDYSVSWNAEGVPSGVYLYRLVAGEFVQTRKMVLIK